MQLLIILRHKARLSIGLIVAIVLMLCGCGGGGDEGGATMPGHEGPNSGIGSLWIVSPSNSGFYQTDRMTVRLKGGSFTPAGSTCPTWVGVLPRNYTVTWSNSLNSASGPVAQVSLNCAVIIITSWDTGDYIPLAVGDNSITVTADDGAGNIGRDTVIVTRVPDTTPPEVVSVYPANGATGVGINSIVSATFSESMDSATIDSTTFTLADGSGNPVLSAVVYDAFSLTATLTPANPLAQNMAYTAIITSVRDAPGGNPLAAPYSFSFTTGM